MATQRVPSSPTWGYDVFLSFRGDDTREGFTSYLYHALCKSGINTFMDVCLSTGEGISPQLCLKIEQSRLSIVVFSENYASSRWCLDELALIMDCKAKWGLQVIPVFYKIEATEIRHQKGKTEEYLSRLGDNSRVNPAELRAWRSALKKAANLSGHVLQKGMIEQDVIQKIVADVSTKLNRATDLYVAHYPVGLDDQIERIDPLLGIEKGDEVRMIGIYGAEGIGKSTIAKAIFNSYRHRFQASSFLANVKATSAKGKLHKVQKTLLSETLWDDRTGPANPSKGANTIGWRLRSKKVLIVIDDVDDLEELRQLAGDQEWFGYGSRIIITTQNEDLLRAHRVRHLYEAKRLDDLYSCQLFCWNAFRRLEPPNPFTKLCRRVLDLIQGIPQALILIGSHLYGRSEAEWETLIVKLEKMSSGGGWDRVLEFAIDGLEKLQRALFLIIACFLNGRSKDVVMRICEISDSIFDVRMEELSDKSMVTVEKNVVWVREPLRGAAKNVLRARSRLKYLVVKLLTELDEATDELGNNIEEAVRNLFHEVFEDSESEEDEEDALVDVADAIGSAAQTVIRGGEAALEEVTYGISSMFEGFSSFFE